MFSPDGKWLASSSLDQTVKVWDATTGQVSHTLRGHSDLVECVAFSPDGALLASASSDMTLKLWDTFTGEECRSFNGHTASVTSVAFGSVGKCLTSGSLDGTVKVWSTVTGLELLTLKEHTLEVHDIAFGPDGLQLVSTGRDGTVIIRDARPWTPELRAEREALSLIHFLRDQDKPQAEWLDAISADHAISEPVRARALQFAREWKP